LIQMISTFNQRRHNSIIMEVSSNNLETAFIRIFKDANKETTLNI